MIPRIFHHIWIGPKPVPEPWINGWKAMHPRWEFRLWREAELAALPMVNRQAYEDYLAQNCWHGASDIARVEILREHGGVYVDVDSRPLLSFEGAPFMAAGFFVGYEPVASLPGRMANGTIGAEAHHPILNTYARLVSEMTDLSEPWNTCGGTGLTAAVLAHLHCCRPMVMPAKTFYATDAHGRAVAGREPSYSEHFWATTNRAYPHRVAIMVPRRADGGRRDAIWEFVQNHWAPLGWPIHEGQHNDGPFNASAARNAAARAADVIKAGCASCTEPWEVAVFVDADTIMLDHEPVRRAVALAAGSGQMVRPYRRYWLTDEAAADHLMLTGTRPRKGLRPLTLQAHGGVNVVPRRLFDEVGGYDERFRGWGSEDTAFELACRAIGGFEQIQGDVFHLWHPISADRSTGDPGFQANVRLRKRYEAASRRSAMRALLDERDGRPPAPPLIGAVVITNGRRECIEQTIPSLEEKVGPFAERVICDDSGDREYAGWLRDTFPTWIVRAHPHLGHAGAVRFALKEAAALDVDWIWWSEDDLVYQRPIDVAAMARVMDAEGDDLKQMVVKRQAWFPSEVEAGGMIERFDPALFQERADNGVSWVEHRVFYSLQPHLVRRSLVEVLRRQWPTTPNSEHQFSVRLFRDPRVRVGLWGAKTEPPWVEHIGMERVGSAY